MLHSPLQTYVYIYIYIQFKKMSKYKTLIHMKSAQKGTLTYEQWFFSCRIVGNTC